MCICRLSSKSLSYSCTVAIDRCTGTSRSRIPTLGDLGIGVSIAAIGCRFFGAQSADLIAATTPTLGPKHAGMPAGTCHSEKHHHFKSCNFANPRNERVLLPIWRAILRPPYRRLEPKRQVRSCARTTTRRKLKSLATLVRRPRWAIGQTLHPRMQRIGHLARALRLGID